MALLPPIKALFCLALLAFAAHAGAKNPSDCPSRLGILRVDAEGPFAPGWQAEDRLLNEFASFDRILMLADGEYLDESFQVAARYPNKRVVGSDLNFEIYFDPPPNMQAKIVDVRNRFPFEDGSFDLVYMRAGLCHCSTTTRACCGVRKTVPAITHFVSEVVRMLDKKAGHSMALLDGNMMADEFLPWMDVCETVAEQHGFRCVPQLLLESGYPSLFWGFKIRR